MSWHMMSQVVRARDRGRVGVHGWQWGLPGHDGGGMGGPWGRAREVHEYALVTCKARGRGQECGVRGTKGQAVGSRPSTVNVTRPCSRGWGSVGAASCKLGVAGVAPQVGRHRASLNPQGKRRIMDGWRPKQATAVTASDHDSCHGTLDHTNAPTMAPIARTPKAKDASLIDSDPGEPQQLQTWDHAPHQ